MKKKNKLPEVGKPYTPKEYRQVGVGLFVVGIIILIFGLSIYQTGLENQIVLTKGGNQIHGSDPHNPLYLIISIFAGIFLWRRGKIKEK
jgi:hypothetical protein